MKRSKFNLSHTKLASMDLGELVPIGLLEVLPGDTIQHATSALVRCAPLLAPVMHPVHVTISHWFVPHRLVWDDWEDFITGGPDGMDASVFPTKSITAGSVAVGSLADYLGIPTDTATGTYTVSALPFRGYALIWNEWFRDQDLQTALVVDTSDGSDTTTPMTLQRCAWEKDYFTTSRPWEQKGPSITIPLGSTAPVVSTGVVPTFQNTLDSVERTLVMDSNGDLEVATSPAATASAIFGDVSGLETDLSGASAVSVNLLREALALQRFEEARARYGSRYVEYLRYLGVRSADARLQRPEYLGGHRQTIQFSEVLQTAEGSNPVGDMYGHGIAGMRSKRFRRFFEEHGYVFSFINVRPKSMYMNGLPRHWAKNTKEMFFQKELQHIGQQEVYNREVYIGAANRGGTFGYQDRYDEYRREWSTVHGEFRTTLDFWHFARNFASEPALNASFVSCTPPEDPFAVPSEDTLYVMAKHNVVARRLLAQTGTSYIF